MRYFTRAGLALVTLFILLLSAAALGQEDIRERHRIVAREMNASIRNGVELRGTIDQNGSRGTFEAWFHDGDYLIRERFGPLESVSYRTQDGSYSGSNHSLPYRSEQSDSPAGTALGMISSGAYLDDPLWEHFTYAGEQAGAYRFRFTPEGLPPVDVLLYSDDEQPEFLQVMQTEVGLAPEDAQSIRYRSYYTYAVDSEGRLHTSSESGRELDYRGLTVNFGIYAVESFTRLAGRPAELAFDTRRIPVGGAGADMAGPVTVPVETSFGYFLVPVTFADGSTHKFILDTGASASLLSPAAVAASGVETSVVTTAHGHGTRQEFELGVVSGASIGSADGPQVPLMPFPATKIPASSREVLEAMAQYGCSGILGVTPFHQYVVTLDHMGKGITFHPQQSFDPAVSFEGGKLSYSIDAEDLIYVTVRINDTLVGQMALDTGLQQDFALLRETMELSGLGFQKVGEATNTVIGGKKDFDYVSVPSFDLGPLRLENKIATMTEDDRGSLVARRMLGFIGLSIFTQARVTLDLFEQRMYIEPPAELIELMREGAADLFDGLVDNKYVTPTAGQRPPVPFGGPSARNNPHEDGIADPDSSGAEPASEGDPEPGQT